MKRVKEGIIQAEHNIDIIYSDERLRAILYYTVDEFEKAITRGVKIRAITTTGQEGAPDKNLQALTKNPSFQLRITEKEIPVGLVIFDDKEVKFRTTENTVPTLWTNNRNVVKLVQIYFNSMWQ